MEFPLQVVFTSKYASTRISLRMQTKNLTKFTVKQGVTVWRMNTQDRPHSAKQKSSKNIERTDQCIKNLVQNKQYS